MDSRTLHLQNDSVYFPNTASASMVAGTFGFCFGTGFGLFMVTAAPMISKFSYGCSLDSTEEYSVKDVVAGFAIVSAFVGTFAAFGVSKLSKCQSSLFGRVDDCNSLAANTQKEVLNGRHLRV